MNPNKAQICVVVDIADGFKTKSFIINVCDYVGEIIYTRTVTDDTDTFEHVTAYINKYFIKYSRFINMKAVFNRSNNIFTYYGIDTTKLKKDEESWVDAGTECPWYESPFEPSPETEKISLEDVS